MLKGTKTRPIEAEETRNNILEVAAREFADKGLAGARIDEIAEKTSSSKRMIYHYFGSKDELYRAVLERAFAQIAAREDEASFETLTAAKALAAHVEHSFDYYVEHPEFVRLMMNENIHYGAHIGHVEGLKERNNNVIALLQAIIDKGVADGTMRDGIDPVELHMTISALCFYNVSNRDTFVSSFGVDMLSAASLKTRRAQITEIVLAWVLR